MFCFLYLVIGGIFPSFSPLANNDSCRFSSTGRNTYFILEPGYQLILEGKDGKKNARLEITVLNETKKVGSVETRVVEERETVDGKLVEISRNFFAYCQESGSVYYFGEEVDIYKNDRVTGHEGAWLAEGKNKAGIIMPGQLVIGQSFFQENAPGIAMDKMEIVSVTEKYDTPAGSFSQVLKTLETTPLEPRAREFKWYAPGIGLIRDEDLLLVKYGFTR
jgi:hypothetical protein